MEPSVSFITLGVADLDRSVAFYRDELGLSTQGIIGSEFENGAVAFFNLRGGLRLALWPRRSIAADTGLAEQAPAPTSFTVAPNTATAAEVDQVMAQAAAAGGVIVKPAQKTFYGGYAGYFQDPDGHLWEVAHNPGLDALG